VIDSVQQEQCGLDLLNRCTENQSRVQPETNERASFRCRLTWLLFRLFQLAEEGVCNALRAHVLFKSLSFRSQPFAENDLAISRGGKRRQ
jgi:hypothetical protein